MTDESNLLNLEAMLVAIHTRRDLISFVDSLALDLDRTPEQWGHTTLSGFLTTLSGTIEVIDRIYENQGLMLPKDIDWRVFGEILMAARIRE